MMIHPLRDFRIALFLLAAGLGLCVFGLGSALAAGWPPQRGAQQASLFGGGLLTLLGLGFVANFAAAARIAKRMLRGEGVIARWIVSPEALKRYAEAEPTRGKSVWRCPPASADVYAPVEVIFAAESVLVDGKLLMLASTGLQSLMTVQLVPDTIPTLEFRFRTQTINSSTGTVSARSDLLRVPATDRSQAETVRDHFVSVLLGRTIVNPDRWGKRIRFGLWSAAIAVVGGIIGWILAIQWQWRADGPWGWLPGTLILIGILGGAGGLIVALAAKRFQNIQRGKNSGR